MNQTNGMRHETQHWLDGDKVTWKKRLIPVVKAARFMVLGALTLVVIEKARRGVFTNDDATALIIVMAMLSFAEVLLNRGSAEPKSERANG